MVRTKVSETLDTSSNLVGDARIFKGLMEYIS